MISRAIFFASVIVGLCAANGLEELFSWKELEFKWPSSGAKEAAIRSGKYVPGNNLPLGLAMWRNKIFITVPRWLPGVASSLNYIDLDSTQQNPPLIPYPDWSANTLPEGNQKIKNNAIVSVFRLSVDVCDRLWVMDTGMDDINGTAKQITPPTLVIFDLNTNQLIRRYPFKNTDVTATSFFVNVVVDVSPYNCDEAFAYAADVSGYGLVVYSFEDNDSWRVNHRFLRFDPLKTNFDVVGIKFQWNDGVFGIALSDDVPNRRLYFHPLSSSNEFSVPTYVLKNKTLATDPSSDSLYMLEGDRGDNGQASANAIDEVTDVMFMGLVNKNAIACWDTNEPLNTDHFEIIYQNNDTMIFPNDLKIDEDRNLYFLTDKMSTFLFSKLDPNDVNHRIFRVNVDDAIKGTRCC